MAGGGSCHSLFPKKCIALLLGLFGDPLARATRLERKCKMIKVKTKVVEVLRGGGVVVFPTETVWGVGALISSGEGVRKFYEVKGREESKPSQVLVGSLEMAQRYGEFSPRAKELAEEFWPGGLTLVLPVKERVVPEQVRAGRETVGLRVPKQEFVLDVIEELGEGIVASSANIAGGFAPRSLAEVDKDWLKNIDLVVDGDVGGGVSSTVVEVLGGKIEVLRQGEIRI